MKLVILLCNYVKINNIIITTHFERRVLEQKKCYYVMTITINNK
jgi:hypothetical protein